jgi:hypothetical protein
MNRVDYQKSALCTEKSPTRLPDRGRRSAYPASNCKNLGFQHIFLLQTTASCVIRAFDSVPDLRIVVPDYYSLTL